MAVASHCCGAIFLGCPSVIVKLNQDASVQVLTGVGCMGQGVETTQAQIVAEELGVPIESITGTHGDTETCPWSPPTVGSINAHITGLVTRAAAADAKRQICELAGEQLGAKPEDLNIKDGMVHIIQQPEKRIAVSEIVGRRTPKFLSPPSVIGRAWGNIPKSPIAKMFMAHFAEVEVDTETGKVNILRYVAVHDSGTIINPSVAENQVSGGVTLGCGFGLVESLIFDEDTGQVLNPNFIDYKVLRALDIPEPEVKFVEVVDPVGAFGVKGIGEGTACPAPAAIAQAVYNATGIRFNNVPITPEKLLRALKDKATSGRSGESFVPLQKP